jgi:hypothetical protein
VKKNLGKKAQFELLLSILRSKPEGLSGTDLQGLSIEDWKNLVDLSLHHRVSGHLLARLTGFTNRPKVPDEAIAILKAIGFRTAVANMKLYSELGVVLQVLQEKSIPVIVLKGAHLAEALYANLTLRPMDDVDILVEKSHLKEVEGVLLDLGYGYLDRVKGEAMDMSHQHLSPFIKKEASPIEVHHSLPRMGETERNLQEIWARAQPTTIAGRKVFALAPEDILVHTAVHTSVQHEFGTRLGALYDISAIVTHYHDVLDWTCISRRAEQWGVKTAVHLTLRAANEMIAAGIPAPALQATAPSQFNPAMLDWAREMIFTTHLEFADSLWVSHRIARVWEYGWSTSSLVELFRLAFPAREDMARWYGLPSTSFRSCYYYPVRWKDLLINRGGVFWRLLRRDRSVIEKAEMYRKLIDPPQELPG